jgi:predicted component of type VI protein secretion system
MKELWLKFTDENGELKRIPVKGEKFAVGRHSENDLSVANSAISRKHVKIERFADIFMISDVGSSLGTQINGVDLTEPVALYNKDKIALGGGFEIEVEIVSDEDESAAAGGADSAKRENEETASAISAADSSAVLRFRRVFSFSLRFSAYWFCSARAGFFWRPAAAEARKTSRKPTNSFIQPNGKRRAKIRRKQRKPLMK